MNRNEETVTDIEYGANHLGKKIAEDARMASEIVKGEAKNICNSAEKLAKGVKDEVTALGQQGYQQIKASGTEAVRQVQSRIEEKPLSSALIAGGFGLLAGILLARR